MKNREKAIAAETANKEEALQEAEGLWGCNEKGVWAEKVACYDALIPTYASAKNKPKLPQLDRFYTQELPHLISSRRPSPFITVEELAKVVEWKLMRGKWRPRLLNFVTSLDDAQVNEASSKAFSALPDLKEAISCLSILKGVGPATASAVLAAYAPHLAPFMSDEAVVAVLGRVKDYSLKEYLLYAEKLQKKAKEVGHTPSELERALWCSAIETNSSLVSQKRTHKLGSSKTDGSQSTPKKRKAR